MMEKIIFWTVVIDAGYQAWQWTFTFKPALSDLLTIVEDDVAPPCLLEQLVRNAQGTDPYIHEKSGSLAYRAAGGAIFIYESEGFTK